MRDFIIRETLVKDKKASVYLAYEIIPTEINNIGYINGFERLYYEIQRYEMTLPTVVLAYRILKSPNISNEKEQLPRATITELNYENMRKQLKAIHDSSSVSTGNSFEIKAEPTYLNDRKDEPVYYANDLTRVPLIIVKEKIVVTRNSGNITT